MQRARYVWRSVRRSEVISITLLTPPVRPPQTLDQLPLTNPEHFGTPVIGKKSNRGGRRSSQAV